MPPIKDCWSTEDRKGVTQTGVSFGDEIYSKEELVAEMGAARLCMVTNIENLTIKNSAGYV